MNLPFDPALAAQSLCAADKRLAKLIEQVGPFTLELKSYPSPFAALARAIVYQQLSGKAAATIMGRVEGLFAGGKITPQTLVDMPHEKLRGVGCSNNKALALRDLAAKTLEGVVPSGSVLRKLDDAEIVERLVQVRGIGVWSVEMLLIFHLGRPDVLPVSDLGVRKGYMLTYRKPEMPVPADLLKHGERWRPYRSVASWYLWRAVDLAKTKSS